MRIETLTLENFRGFGRFSLELHPAMTVLVGTNAAGKTSVLEGAAVSLGGFLAAIPVRGARHLRSDDVREVSRELGGAYQLEPQFPCRVDTVGQLNDQPMSWSRDVRSYTGRTSRAGARALKETVDELTRGVQAGQKVELPVLAYYGTQRVWQQLKATDAKRGVGSRLDGYVDALDPATNHRLLAEWMYQKTLVELQQLTAREMPTTLHRMSQLAAVQSAVVECIADATDFRFNVAEQRLELVLAGEMVPFDHLSDGYRNMVGLVADLARRSAVLNPHHRERAPGQATGVVLIDEVELHLHPTWQRTVLGDLRRTFPKLQFVVTTHSPQILAGAADARVLLLTRSAATPVEIRHFAGRETNGLLRDVFGVPERAPAVQKELDELARLIDAEDGAKAHELLERLRTMLGPDDPAIQRAEWTIDLEGE